MKHLFFSGITLLGFFLLFSCQTIRQNHSSPFRVKDARYYTWYAGGEKERGTNVEITVDRWQGELQFEAVIFRNMKIPLATIVEGKRILLKGVLPGPQSVLEDRTTPAEGPDRLLYVFNGDTASVILENIQREEMRYLKPM